MAKTKGPFRDSRALSWLSGPRTDVPAESPSHRSCIHMITCVSLTKISESYRLGLSIYNNATHTVIWEDRHFNHKPKTLA